MKNRPRFGVGGVKQSRLELIRGPWGLGTVCWIEVKVAVLCAQQYMPWNLLIIKVLNNFWYFKHQIPTMIGSKAYLKHYWRNCLQILSFFIDFNNNFSSAWGSFGTNPLVPPDFQTFLRSCLGCACTCNPIMAPPRERLLSFVITEYEQYVWSKPNFLVEQNL